MAMRYMGMIVPALVLLLSLAAAQPVESQVPRASDYAPATEKAPQLAKAGLTHRPGAMTSGPIANALAP